MEGAHVIPKGIVIGPFKYDEQNESLKKFSRAILVRKGAAEGLVALQFLGHLKRTLELLIFVRKSPLATF